MEKATLKALQGSIRKWERIAKGKVSNRGGQDCPLCQLFNWKPRLENNCVGCPVAAATGRQYCEGSPYDEFWDASAATKGRAATPKAKKLALAELAFLRALLPATSEENQC